MELSGIIFKGKGHSFSPSLFSSSGWNMDVMAGARSAVLDYEVKVYVEDWRSTGPKDHGATVPALDSYVYVRNKLPLCSNYATSDRMLQISSKHSTSSAELGGSGWQE